MSVTSAPPSTDAAPPQHQGQAERGAPNWIVVALIAAPTLLVLLIMSGVLGPIGTGRSLFSFPELLVANTPTGGDMGAHVLLPKVLLESLLPSGRIMGWSMDWYAGFPALYFYFPLPALTTVLLDLVLPYGVAFKLVTIAGLVALPLATYVFVRLLGFSRVVAAVAALTGSMYVFMESFSIFGANIKSTLAGEFSFSWSFALSIVYLGLVVRDTREGRPFSPLAAVVLALTALTHIVTTIIVVLVSLPLLLRRSGAKSLGPAWLIGFGLSAFWALPLGIRVLQGMTTDMGWAPVRNVVGDAIPGSPLPGEFIPIFVLGMIGLVWTALRRYDVVVLVWLAALPLIGYFVIAKIEFTVLYNARLLPYWYFAMFVFAGLAIGLAVVEAARRLPGRRYNMTVGAVGAGLLVLIATTVSIHDVPGWVEWNYEGYEGKDAAGMVAGTNWEEYSALMETIATLPPGRVMWEANSEMNRYGTPMALMLFPFWSEEHPSMEGLFFESSLTTPFHFLNASEVSLRPSNPVRGLTYRGMDFERAEAHLALYDVAYYVSFTEEATQAAVDHGLAQVGASPPWTIFAMPETGPVDVASIEPAVWDGEGDFVEAALEWYDDVENLDHWLVEGGPEAWRRVEDTESRLDSPRPLAESGVVSDVVIEDHRISFATTAVGVPHLVKVSYFPNWQASGAEGPWRAAPSLMVVIPTQEEVVLEFNNTWAENVGMLLTLVAGAGVVTWYVRRRRRAAA